MKDYSPQVIADVVRLLNENGIQTEAVFEPIGPQCSFHPSPQDIVYMIQDRDAFFSRECALSKDDYQDWKRFIQEGCHCTAITRQGSRCRHRVQEFAELSPQRYVERRNSDELRCGTHTR